MVKSVKVRLTLVFTSIFAAFLISLGTYVYITSAHREWDRFDQQLIADTIVLGDSYFEDMNERDAGIVEDWVGELKQFAEALGASAILYDEKGRIIVGTEDMNVLRPPPVLKSSVQEIRTQSLALAPGRQDYRVVYVTVTNPKQKPVHMIVARPVQKVVQHLREQLLGLSVMVPLFIVLGAFFGYLFVKAALRPVDDMAQLARKISVSDLSERVPLPKSEGELRMLALTLNSMLERLELAFARLRAFTADTAHELRTPISTIRTILESSLGPFGDVRREAVVDAIEEVSHLTEIVEKLLLLARADAGRLLSIREPIEMVELVRQVVDVVQVAASERRMDIRVTAAGPVTVAGDPLLLIRVIHNLLDNAVKYGREGGVIDVELKPEGISIRDDGPGIAAEHLPRIFDRMYRADGSRSDRVPGTGLGLSIARSITEAHGGTLTAESIPGRTTFLLKLPVETEGLSCRSAG
jgi:heavy metal sensor kinase